MATYFELLGAVEDPSLNKKVRIACVVAAEAVRVEAGATPNHANRLLWAKAVFEDPISAGERMIWAILAQNKDLTPAQIAGATDAQVQSGVENAIDVFATGV